MELLQTEGRSWRRRGQIRWQGARQAKDVSGSADLRGVGTRWSLRSLPTLPILWFYDSKSASTRGLAISSLSRFQPWEMLKIQSISQDWTYSYFRHRRAKVQPRRLLQGIARKENPQAGRSVPPWPRLMEHRSHPPALISRSPPKSRCRAVEQSLSTGPSNISRAGSPCWPKLTGQLKVPLQQRKPLVALGWPPALRHSLPSLRPGWDRGKQRSATDDCLTRLLMPAGPWSLNDSHGVRGAWKWMSRPSPPTTLVNSAEQGLDAAEDSDH